MPALDAILAGRRALLVVAPEINAAALSVLLVNRERGTLETLAVKAPSHGEQRTKILEDLASSDERKAARL